MHRGTALALALLGPLAAALLLAPAAGAVVACQQPQACVATIRPSEELMRDTWINEADPDTNNDVGQDAGWLFVRAGTDKRAVTLLRFPLGELPRNITFETASITLFQSSSAAGGVTNAGGTTERTLRMHEVLAPWDERTVNWTLGSPLPVHPDPVHNHTIQTNPIGGECQGICPVTFFGFGRGGIKGSFVKYYLGLEPYHGHLLRDYDTTNADLVAQQQYFSSSDLNEESLRPSLRVEYNPNPPDLDDLRADGRIHLNATSASALNVSFVVSDKLGSVVNAWINATDETGKEWFNRSVFQNRSTVFRDVFKHTVWTHEPLHLPEGKYIFNVFALDDDGNLNYTRYTQANVTVENELPFLNQTRDAAGAAVPVVSRTEAGEGDRIEVAVSAEDPRSGVANVTLEVTRDGAVLANASLQPRRVDANQSGEWNLTVRAGWAGRLELWVWASDTAGNLNRTGPFPLHVRDVLPPRIHEARVVTPGRGPEGAFQEEGGVVRWDVTVSDASPLNVTLFLDAPQAGGEQAVPMVPVELCRNGIDDDRDGAIDEDGCGLPAFTGDVLGVVSLYRHEAALPDRGSYGARVVVVDPDGNRDERGGLGLVVLGAQPPVIDELRPADGSTGPGRPVLSARVGDLNLDPSSITLEVRVGAGPFTPLEARTSLLTETTRRVEVQEQFFHEETVEVRVRARDLLGNAAERTWSFAVDARSPVTFLAPEGTFLVDGERTALTGNTTLRLDRDDEGSGVLATVVQVVHDDRALSSGNVTITGSGEARFNLSASPVFAGTGNYTVFFASADAAGNVEEVQRRRFLVDDAAPVVQARFEPGVVVATVREAGTGVREVRAQYWLSPSGVQGTALMSPSADNATWVAQVPDAERGTQVLYAVEAVDRLGNVGRAGSAASPLRAVVQNHPPTIQLAPGNGSLVRGAVEITWAASDRDGDAVATTLRVRASTVRDAVVLAPERGAQGSFTWDTRGVGDGLWEIIVTARDGFEAASASTWVDVTNTDSKVVALRVEAGQPGQPVRVEATLLKPVRKAEAVVRLGAEEVARVPLRDDGTAPDRRPGDGVFSGQFVASIAGDYRVDLEVLFEDGRLEARDGAAVASVQWGFPARIVNDPLVFLLVVGVPLGAAGVWAWRRYGPVKVRMRR